MIDSKREASPINTGDGDGLPVVDGYQILAEIGRGAAGVVYRARHLTLNRLVALKLIHAGGGLSPEARQRFIVEARAAARLRHGNIVEIYDVGEQQGCPFLSLELVEGETLARRLGRGRMNARQAGELMEKMARAIEYAHQQGVIHRDLKPANVMLGGSDGSLHGRSGYELKITDFGLAKLLPIAGAPDDHMTQSGVMLGTPAYSPPEQARGRVRKIGPTSDVYSLGAILYELLAGRPPFRGATALETLMLAADTEPVPPSRIHGPVPRDLETICLKCMEKDPARRYPTAAELADDLARFLDYEPIHARPLGRVERGIRWIRRRPAQSALLAASLLIACILIYAGVWLHEQRQAIIRAVTVDLREAERLVKSSAWTQAANVLDRAQARLGNGGPEDLRQRVNQARQVMDSSRHRYELIQRFENIRLARVTNVEARFDPAAEARFRNQRADREYGSALPDSHLGLVGEDAATVASRIAALNLASELTAALDDWRVCAADRPRRDWLADVVARIDPDTRRNQVRNPQVWEDPGAISSAGAASSVLGQPVEFLIAVGDRLGQAGKDGMAFLKVVQADRPDDFWANFALGNILLADHAQEAATFYRRAVVSRPESVAALNNLGLAQYATFGIFEATQTYHQALDLKPDDAHVLNNLGQVSKAAGNVFDAEAHFRDAVKFDPTLPEAQFNLANLLSARGGPDVVIHLRRAVANDSQFARAHYLLGAALCARTPIDEANAIRTGRDQRRWDGVISEPLDYYHKAVEFDPTWVPVTQDRMRSNDAVAEYRLAIACDPWLTHAYGALGQALLNQGHFGEALEATAHATDLLRQHRPREDRLSDQAKAALASQLLRCQRSLSLEARLPAIIDGSQKPANAAETLELADICVAQNRHLPAARLYRQAFDADPILIQNDKSGRRYRAACSAALAGAKLTLDSNDSSDEERSNWRRQAIKWLRADMDQLANRLDARQGDAAVMIYLLLSHWLQDPALAAIRDDFALAQVPGDEAESCRTLWGQINAIRSRAETIVDQQSF